MRCILKKFYWAQMHIMKLIIFELKVNMKIFEWRYSNDFECSGYWYIYYHTKIILGLTSTVDLIVASTGEYHEPHKYPGFKGPVV